MISNTLKVVHINIRSILSKIDLLKDFLLEADYDIVAVGETWLNDNISDDVIYIEGYRVLRLDRGRGGGVCIYYKNSFAVTEFGIINELIQQIWIVFKINRTKLAISVVYKPPRQNYKLFCDELERVCTQLSFICDYFLCLGDLNINLLEPGEPDCRYLNSLFDVLGCKQLITEATRSADRESLLDLIFISDTNIVLNSGIDPFKFADHETIFCNLTIKTYNQPTKKLIRSFKNFNIDSFQNDIRLIPWQNIIYLNNIDDKINFLNSNILAVLNKHAPLKSYKLAKKRVPWLTDNTRSMMKLRDKAYQKFKRTKNPGHWEYYKSLRNLTTRTIQNEKRAYLQHIFSNSTPKDTWKELKALNVLSNKNCDIPVHLQHPNEINNFFLENIPGDDMNNAVADTVNHYSLGEINFDTLDFVPVCTEVVIKFINEIKSNSTGWDGLNINIIKYCCPIILPYVVHIINYCIIHSIFPNSWKRGLVLPLPKNNNPTEYKDLRPISILPVLSKLLEKIINMQLRKHLDKYSIISEVQSGFRPGYSCTTVLMRVTDELLLATDQGKVSVLALLDFSKAFDTINHEILLAILHHIGLTSNAVTLIRSYLSDRMQCVRLQNNLSDWKVITRGVPQGSILGPLLFTIYTHSFCDYITTCKINMYADDTQLHYSFLVENHQQAMESIQTDLDTISEISSKHCLKINPLKSIIVLFGSSQGIRLLQSHINLSINGIPIPVKDEARNLGLVIDNAFRFSTQVSTSIKRAYANLKLIYPYRQNLSINIKTMLCDTLVLSHFSYCAQVYGPLLTNDNAQRIQRVQNSCIRLIYGIRKYDHVSHKLADLKWLNMQNRRRLLTACLYHKIIIQKKPAYLYEKIKFRTDVHTLNLRFKGTITPPLHRTSLYEGGFSYNISKVYNALNEDLKNSTVTSFKRKYRQVLFDSQI